MNRALRLGAALVVQAALVVVAVQAPLSARLSGEEVLLRVEPVDPMDPFRGAYVDLGYPDLPGPADEVDRPDADARGPVYVPLTRQGEVWVGAAATRTRPAAAPYLTCDDSGWRLSCGIESLFLPQDRATAVEEAVREGSLVARVRVDGRGHAALLGVQPAG